MNDGVQYAFLPTPVEDLIGRIAAEVCVRIGRATDQGRLEPEVLLTTEAAAEFLQVTEPTVREYRRKGYIQGHRIGGRVRYKRSELLGGLQAIRTRKTNRQ